MYIINTQAIRLQDKIQFEVFILRLMYFFFVLLFCFAGLGFPQSDTIDINFWRHFSVFLFVTQLNGIQFTLKLFGILITQIPNSLSAGTAKL